HVRNQFAVFAQLNIRAYDAIWANRARTRNLCTGIDDRSRMDAHCESGLRLVLHCGFRLARPTYQLEGDQRFAGKLAIHEGLALHIDRSRTPYDHVDLNPELIAGKHRSPELCAFNAGEDHQLVLTIRISV